LARGAEPDQRLSMEPNTTVAMGGNAKCERDPLFVFLFSAPSRVAKGPA